MFDHKIMFIKPKWCIYEEQCQKKQFTSHCPKITQKVIHIHYTYALGLVNYSLICYVRFKECL